LLYSEQQEITMAAPLTVRPDAKGRITLGAYAKGVSSYHIHEEKDGRLILEPYKEVPAREAWLYKNRKALAMVEKGLKEAKDAKTSSRGKFSKYLDD
jgi:hypothetical protein